MRRIGSGHRPRARAGASRPVPVNLTAPSISPSSFSIGTVVSVTPGTWSGSPTLTYQWQLDDVDIDGATGTAHTARTEDVIGLLSVLEIPNGNRALAARSNSIALTGTTLLLNHLGWWLDGTDARVRLVRNRMMAGETIQDWQRGYFSQPLADRRPARATRNGYPVLQFSTGSKQALYQAIDGALNKGNILSFFDPTTRHHSVVCDFLVNSMADTNGAHESFHGSLEVKTWGMGPFGTSGTRWYGYRFQDGSGTWAIVNRGPNAFSIGSVETGIGWYDGSVLGCRVGSSEGTTSVTSVTSQVGPLTLGRYYVSAGEPIDYNGQILRYHVLNRALSLEERQAMRTASQARFVTGAAYTGNPITKPAAVDPDTVSDCTAVYDESGLDQQSQIGSHVDQWTSRVAGAPPLLADASDTTRPTIDQHAGKRCLLFTRASSQRLRCAANRSLAEILGSGSYTIFVVARDDVSDGQGTSIANGASVVSSDTPSEGFAHAIHYQPGGYGTDRNGAFHKNSSNPDGFTFFIHKNAIPFHENGVRVSWTRFNASDGRLASRFASTLDWIVGCSSLDAGAASSRIVVGRRGSTSNFWNGRIYEIVAFSRALSIAEIERIEQYLFERWSG